MSAGRRAAFAEESAEVEVLFANMDKLQTLTKKIQGSLNRLETSGNNVKDAIGPIHGNTQRLQVQNRNIDRLLEELERLRQTSDQRGQEENVIRADPRKVGIPDYVASLKRATRALQGLRSSGLKSNQTAVQETTDILRFGAKQLEYVFKETLKDNSAPVEPLHYLTKNQEFPTLPSEKVSQLRLINSYISITHSQTFQDVSSSTPSTMRAYAEIRGEYLTTSLRGLAAACISTARKTNAEALYKAKTNGFNAYSGTLQKMISREFETIQRVFEPGEVDRACLTTCQSALREFTKTLRELEAHIRNYLTTDCFLAFEILDIMNGAILPGLRNQAPPVERPVIDAIQPIREVGIASFARLIEDAKNRVNSLPPSAMPADGSPVPVTAETMSRLQLLTEHMRVVAPMLISLGEGGWSAAPGSSAGSRALFNDPDTDGRGPALFARFATDVIEATLAALDARARIMIKNTAAQGVFMANNVTIIERMIRSSALSSYLGSIGPSLETWRRKSTAMYLAAWREPAAYLMDVQHTNRQRPPSGQQDSASVVRALGSKEKDGIKEKFRSFNASFDELAAKHRMYKMEREVKTQLTKEVQGMIEPMYGRFWDRYHELDKGKGKYVKYDRGSLAATLTSMA